MRELKQLAAAVMIFIVVVFL
ncbi:hypothetical protein CH13_gp038 [Mycobacterium phage Echild]|nr:hypothetical protein CH13_gp038 [Mycobacterium phage Echild]AHG24259.1 hypothetical protein PBI_ECHILD_38 [Mycobacterium phage Echild]